MAKKQEVDSCNMSDECRKCKLNTLYGGKCTGRTRMRAIPCLGFQELDKPRS